MADSGFQCSPGSSSAEESSATFVEASAFISSYSSTSKQYVIEVADLDCEVVTRPNDNNEEEEEEEEEDVLNRWTIKKSFEHFKLLRENIEKKLSSKKQGDAKTGHTPKIPTLPSAKLAKFNPSKQIPVLNNFLNSILSDPSLFLPCAYLILTFLNFKISSTRAALRKVADDSPTPSSDNSDKDNLDAVDIKWLGHHDLEKYQKQLENSKKASKNKNSWENTKGWMKKEGGRVKTWKKRFFAMNRTHLLYFQNEPSESFSMADFMGYIPLSNSIVTSQLTEEEQKLKPKYSFKIMSYRRTFFLQPVLLKNTNDPAKDEEKIKQRRDRWVSKLKRVVNDPIDSCLLYFDLTDSVSDGNQKKKKNLVRQQKYQIRKTGHFVKQGAFIQSWKRRYFVLENETLYYFKNDVEKLCGEIFLTGSTVRLLGNDYSSDLLKRDNVIQIETPKRTYYLVAELGQEQMDEWFPYLLKASLLFPIHNPETQLHLVKKGTSIRYILQYCNEGDTIEIEPGVYKENFDLDKPLFFRNRDPSAGPVIIVADDPQKPIIYIKKRLCRFDNIEFRGPLFADDEKAEKNDDEREKTIDEYDLISIKDACAFFRQCRISGSTGNGIKASNQGQVFAHGTRIDHNTGCGISVTNTSKGKQFQTSFIIVEHCIIDHNVCDGILVMGDCHLTIHHTSVFKNKYNGISSGAVESLRIHACHVHSNCYDALTLSKVPKNLCKIYDNKLEVDGDRNCTLYIPDNLNNKLVTSIDNDAKK